MSQRLMKAIKDKTIGKETPQELMLVITYEIGELAKCLSRAKNFPKEEQGWLGEAKCALADTLVQLEIMCELFDLDFDAVINLGEKRLVQRMDEIARRDKSG